MTDSALVRILLLEDDASLRRDVGAALRAAGHSVDEAATIAAADENVWVHDYDLAVLDRMIGADDSAALVRGLREQHRAVPVLFLTALSGIEHRVEGLDAGADDYLVKPFAMSELLARVRSLGRRSPMATAPVLRLGDLVIDPAAMTARRGDTALVLTAKEFALLAYLAVHPGRVVSRTELLEHCWDDFADPRSNTVDVRVRLLRAKLGEPPLIHTVRGAGYLARP